jgi:hypothetical protein
MREKIPIVLYIMSGQEEFKLYKLKIAQIFSILTICSAHLNGRRCSFRLRGDCVRRLRGAPLFVGLNTGARPRKGARGRVDEVSGGYFFLVESYATA